MPDLTPADWEAVRAYAYHDMGLTAAARELHMHVNTLRYHLGKVYEVTGLNPNLKIIRGPGIMARRLQTWRNL